MCSRSNNDTNLLCDLGQAPTALDGGFSHLQNSQGFYYDYHVFIVLIQWHVLTTLDVLCHLDQTITSIYKRGNWQRESLSSQIF